MLLEGEWAEVRDQTSWTPERFTSAVYQQVMAGKPRMAGARAALEQFGVPEVGIRAERYAAAKQAQVVELIQEGRFMAFPDALRFLLAAKAGGMAAIGVARLDDRDLLVEAGADLVVPTLDDVCRPALAEGRLEERQAAAELRRRHTERPPSVWSLVYDGFDPARQGLREAGRYARTLVLDRRSGPRVAGYSSQASSNDSLACLERRLTRPAGPGQV